MPDSPALKEAKRRYRSKIKTVAVLFPKCETHIYEWVTSHGVPAATYIRKLIKDAYRKETTE